MPIIACLGWGSLIWNPDKLPVVLPWTQDGPIVRVEFLRKSSKGRVTLVLDETAPPVRALWARMKLADIPVAVTALGKREGTPSKSIGVWRTGEDSPVLIDELPAWAQAHDIDAVIWTALGRTFSNSKDVVAYLQSRMDAERTNAEQYVRYAPAHISTPIRHDIEQALGWTPQAPPADSDAALLLACANKPCDKEPQSMEPQNPMTDKEEKSSNSSGEAEGLASMPAFITDVLAKAGTHEGADAALLEILEKHIVRAEPSLFPVEQAFADIEKLAELRVAQELKDGEHNHD